MIEKEGYFCRSFCADDEKEVKALIHNAFPDFLNGEYWNWKYKLNPDFDPSLVTVAESGGRIIGCNHWLLTTFKLSPTIVTKAVLGADIAVDSNFRFKGVGKALIHSQRSSEAIKRIDPSFVYMFADPSLAKHFHSPSGGYIPAQENTVLCVKILSWKNLEPHVLSINEQIASGRFKERLSNIKLNVVFKLPNAPELKFCITSKGVEMAEGAQNRKIAAEVVIRTDLFTLQKVGGKRNPAWHILIALVTGKLKINGEVRKLYSFYKNMWVIKAILSEGLI